MKLLWHEAFMAHPYFSSASQSNVQIPVKNETSQKETSKNSINIKWTMEQNILLLNWQNLKP